MQICFILNNIRVKSSGGNITGYNALLLAKHVTFRKKKPPYFWEYAFVVCDLLHNGQND